MVNQRFMTSLGIAVACIALLSFEPGTSGQRANADCEPQPCGSNSLCVSLNFIGLQCAERTEGESKECTCIINIPNQPHLDYCDHNFYATWPLDGPMVYYSSSPVPCPNTGRCFEWGTGKCWWYNRCSGTIPRDGCLAGGGLPVCWSVYYTDDEEEAYWITTQPCCYCFQ
jgi:hypothetical protein